MNWEAQSHKHTNPASLLAALKGYAVLLAIWTGTPVHNHRLRVSPSHEQREIRVDGEGRSGEAPLVLMGLVQIAVVVSYTKMK